MRGGFRHLYREGKMTKEELIKLREDTEVIIKRILIVDAELNAIQQIASLIIMAVDEMLEAIKEREGGEY